MPSIFTVFRQLWVVTAGGEAGMTPVSRDIVLLTILDRPMRNSIDEVGPFYLAHTI